MAAPTRNYTEPTFVCRKIEPIAPVAFKVRQLFYSPASIPHQIDFGIPSAVNAVSAAKQPVVPFKAPPPPMGRVIISMLPYVYKERPVLVGRIYPTGIRR